MGIPHDVGVLLSPTTMTCLVLGLEILKSYSKHAVNNKLLLLLLCSGRHTIVESLQWYNISHDSDVNFVDLTMESVADLTVKLNVTWL